MRILAPIESMEQMMSDLSKIITDLPAQEMSELVKLLADKAVKNGNVVELLRSNVGHYGWVTAVAANYIEDLQSKIRTLEAGTQ